MTVQDSLSVAYGDKWYADAENYWSRVEGSVQGMLGGLGHLHELDACTSLALLRSLKSLHPLYSGDQPTRACDCGAGIGRVSQDVLLQIFDRVDMVEPMAHFLDEAKQNPILKDKVDRFVCQGLQDFQPESGRYDVIWTQWVIGHLTDDDLVAFIKRSLESLRDKGGLLIMKENVSRKQDYIVDEEDSSVTRSKVVFHRLFKQAGAELVLERVQPHFPTELFPVFMFVLK